MATVSAKHKFRSFYKREASCDSWFEMADQGCAYDSPEKYFLVSDHVFV